MAPADRCFVLPHSGRRRSHDAHRVHAPNGHRRQHRRRSRSRADRLRRADDLPAETSTDLTDRAVEALNDIASEREAAGGGNVLVVSSGITISLALEELGADMSGVTKGIENAAVSELTYDGGEWTVDTVNDLSYVEAGAGI